MADKQAVAEWFDLSGRVAVVTGGAMGIGREIADGLAAAGAHVVITSRDPAKSRGNPGHETLAMDVTDAASVAHAFEHVASRHGRLDILVNNAGGAPAGGPYSLLDRKLEDWNHVIATNLSGTFLCTQAAARIMIKAHSGSIVNIASIAAIVGRDRGIYDGLDMRPNLVDYAAAKAGVVGFTRDAAAELGSHGIRVNAVSPGGVFRNHDPEFVRRYSAKTPLGRMAAEGRDMRGTVLLLASDAGAYITGANIVVDGGFVTYK